MCAAVQPFLSGAISKTYNMPHDATVKDVELAFLKAWERGVKAVAVYRKGSKLSEPLRVEELKAQTKTKPTIQRESLPTNRRAQIHKFLVGGYAGYLTVGFYDDGRLGEMFLRMAKPGSMVSGLLDSFATAISYLLQYGVPLTELVRKFEAVKFSPNGLTANPEIVFATSIIDYVFKWLKHEFLTNEQQREIEARREKKLVEAQSHSPEMDEMDFDLSSDPCPNCGSPMVKTGSCSVCRSCSHSTGVCS
jgi:ribonucleoside-diphosphate reductase alpha chain